MSSAADAALRVAVPAGFSAGELAAPDLSQSPQLAVEQWKSARDASGHEALAWGCIAGDASSWSADATEIAQGKLAEIASGTAARMRAARSHDDAATPMHVTSVSADGRVRALAADAPAARRSSAASAADAREPAAVARTFVAFTRAGGQARAHGCFVVCAAPASREQAAAGAGAVDGASVSGALAAQPPPGLVLRSLGLAVHHPHGALAVLGGALALAAALALATRPGKGRKRRMTKPFRA